MNGPLDLPSNESTQPLRLNRPLTPHIDPFAEPSKSELDSSSDRGFVNSPQISSPVASSSSSVINKGVEPKEHLQ